ncbi:uncharacterized [Tachysurus ichikawai]
MHQRKGNWDRRRGKKERDGASACGRTLRSSDQTLFSPSRTVSDETSLQYPALPTKPFTTSIPLLLLREREQARQTKGLKENKSSGGKFALPATYKELGK